MKQEEAIECATQARAFCLKTGYQAALPQAMEKLVKFTRENPRAGIFQAAEKKP